MLDNSQDLQQISINMKTTLLVQELKSSENARVDDEGQQQMEQSPIKSIFKIKKTKCVVCKKLCSYRCPKCKKNYCSIEHYRSHNLFCSEQFYERQVKQSLKGLKVTENSQKKKAIQMVRNYQQEIDDDCRIGDLTVQRLEELLKEIEEGKEPKLSKNQEQHFQQYLNSLNLQPDLLVGKGGKNQQNQEQQIELQKAYWEEEQGLSLYLQENIEIEEYAESQNPQLIAQRSLYKKQLDQFTALHPFAESVIKPILNAHLIQVIFAYVLLHRVYDGEFLQFRDIFINAYCSKENQVLLKSEDVELKDLINQMQIQVLRNQKDKDGQAVLRLWMGEYWELLMSDLSKIFSNPFLVMETLLRIVELINCKDKKYEEVIGSGNENGNILSKQQRKRIKMQTKIVKKCEYLLYFVRYRYRKQACFPHLNYLAQHMRYQGQPNPQQRQTLNLGIANRTN